MDMEGFKCAPEMPDVVAIAMVAATAQTTAMGKRPEKEPQKMSLIMEPQPIWTRRNVPMNSARSFLNNLLLHSSGLGLEAPARSVTADCSVFVSDDNNP